MGDFPTLRYQSPGYSHLMAGDGQHIDQRRDFYRRPRLRLSTPEPPHSSSSASPSSSSGGCDTMPSPWYSAPSESEQRLYSSQLPTQASPPALDALFEVRPPVDYSFREADLFYGIHAGNASTQDGLNSVSAGHTSCEPPTRSDAGQRPGTGKNAQSWRSAFSATWTKLSSALAPPEPKEEGFQVVRPGNAALRMAKMQQAQARAHGQAEVIRFGHVQAGDSDAPHDDVPDGTCRHDNAAP